MGRMLNLVVTDIDCEVLREPLSLVSEDAHHPSLSVVCNMNGAIYNELTATAYNFKKANFIGLYNALTYIDWSFLSKTDDINSMCYLFYQKFTKCSTFICQNILKRNASILFGITKK
nr:unnamed protein product [Callosobruchus analis]